MMSSESASDWKDPKFLGPVCHEWLPRLHDDDETSAGVFRCSCKAWRDAALGCEYHQLEYKAWQARELASLAAFCRKHPRVGHLQISTADPEFAECDSRSDAVREMMESLPRGCTSLHLQGGVAVPYALYQAAERLTSLQCLTLQHLPYRWSYEEGSLPWPEGLLLQQQGQQQQASSATAAAGAGSSAGGMQPLEDSITGKAQLPSAGSVQEQLQQLVLEDTQAAGASRPSSMPAAQKLPAAAAAAAAAAAQSAAAASSSAASSSPAAAALQASARLHKGLYGAPVYRRFRRYWETYQLATGHLLRSAGGHLRELHLEAPARTLGLDVVELLAAAGNTQLTSLTLGGIGGRYDGHLQWNEATAGLRLAQLDQLPSLERLHLSNCGCALMHGTVLEALGRLKALALPHCCLLLAGGTPRLQLLEGLEELSLKHCDWLLVEQQAAQVPAAATAVEAALVAAGAPAGLVEAHAATGAAANPAAAAQPVVMDEAAVERWAVASSSQVLLLPGSITDLQLEGFVGPEPQTSQLAGLTRLQPAAIVSLQGMAAALLQHVAAYAALQELRLTGPQQEDLAVLRRLPALTCLHCLELSGRPQDLVDLGLTQLQELHIELCESSEDQCELSITPAQLPQLHTLCLDGHDLRLALLDVSCLQGLTRLLLGPDCEAVLLDGLVVPAGLLQLEVCLGQEDVSVSARAGGDGEESGEDGSDSERSREGASAAGAMVGAAAAAAGSSGVSAAAEESGDSSDSGSRSTVYYESPSSSGGDRRWRWRRARPAHWLTLLARLPQLQLLRLFHEVLPPDRKLLRLLPHVRHLYLHGWPVRGPSALRVVRDDLLELCPEVQEVEVADGRAAVFRRGVGATRLRVRSTNPG